MTFSGAKLALFLGHELLVIRRDDNPGIPYPNHWDLPGGGREGDESPAACALRETQEEVGLALREADLTWARHYERPRGTVWFFAAHLPAAAAGRIRFGDEGQGWRLMDPARYCTHPLAVPHFAQQLRSYLDFAGVAWKKDPPLLKAGAVDGPQEEKPVGECPS
ncbi:NUDIX hydrolase [Roseobacteraceae bacterium NS-SX3]